MHTILFSKIENNSNMKGLKDQKHLQNLWKTADIEVHFS